MVTVLRRLGWQVLKQAHSFNLVAACTVHTTSHVTLQKKAQSNEELRSLIVQSETFKRVKVKDKEMFHAVISRFEKESPNRRGVIEFIHAALKSLEEFGVHRDLETYKRLMDLFPKGKMIPKNMLQREFHHYPMHLDCAMNIMDEMEYNRLMPDREMYELVINIFGRWSLPYKKMGRLFYWMPKFLNASPYPLPREIPNDALEIAKLALKRMSSVDLQTKISIHEAEELEDSVDPTWIVSAQSPTQQRFISELPEFKPIYVEGPFTIWIRRQSLSYFILRGDALPEKPEITKEQRDDISGISLWMFGEEKKEVDLIKPPSVHEQKDGLYLGMCATGTSSRDSLLSWIRFLQKSNPKLSENIPVLFKLRSAPTELTTVNDNAKNYEIEADEKKLFENFKDSND